MEAVPKLPMMSFELKISPVCPDFATPFKRFITKYYGEDGDLYDREIMELENLRNSSCRVVRDYTGCSQLKRYYAQIFSLWNRFSAFENGEVGVQCAWADIYTGQTNIGDLDFELACVLYNIGALHAELGAADQRATAEAMKVSCTHFQCASWAFQHLIDNQILCRSSNDLTNDVLQFLVQIMLAQAQECILEKSMLDNRKASIVAKVAAQVVEYYRSAINMLQQGAMNTSSVSSITEIIGSKLFKEWKKTVEFKLNYYGSISSLYMGNMAEEQQKMGDRVAWYESAEAKMKETAKLAKQLDSGTANPQLVGEAITFVADVITVKLSNAKKENDFIYHEKVTPIEQLSEIKGASLVKGIPFNVSDPEICGTDIFARLVPIEAHETASVYSAKKDELLRKIRLKIDEHNQDLAAYLSSLQLDKQSLRAPKQDQIPDELIDICAELSLDSNGVETVEASLNELNSICEETDRLINESKQLLQSEQTKESEHREKFGNTGPPSLILAELTKELAKHEATHRKAIESNRSLWENFDQHKDDVRIMTSSSASKIASILPSNKDVPMEGTTIDEMEKIFDKIDEMKQQREMLQQKLQQQIDQDNILKMVMTVRKGEIDGLFEREIKKYDKLTGLIEMNLAAQHNMLRALTEHNAHYAQTRKALIENQRNRKTRIASLMYTYQVFKELRFNSKKGIEFYHKFQPIVERLMDRIRAVSKVQDEERIQFVNAQAKRLAIASAASATAVSAGAGNPILNNNNNNINAATANRYTGEMPQSTLTNPPAPIPATGAKLKDYLPYMNSSTAIPALSYLSSAVSAANAVPLTQNYPPHAPAPLSVPSPGPQPPSAPSPGLQSNYQSYLSTSTSSSGASIQYQYPSPGPTNLAQQPQQQRLPYQQPYPGQATSGSQYLPSTPSPAPSGQSSGAIATTVSYALPTITATSQYQPQQVKPQPQSQYQYQPQSQQHQQTYSQPSQPISSVVPIHSNSNAYGGVPNSYYSPQPQGQVPGSQLSTVSSSSSSYYYPAPTISTSTTTTPTLHHQQHQQPYSQPQQQQQQQQVSINYPSQPQSQSQLYNPAPSNYSQPQQMPGNVMVNHQYNNNSNIPAHQNPYQTPQSQQQQSYNLGPSYQSAPTNANPYTVPNNNNQVGPSYGGIAQPQQQPQQFVNSSMAPQPQQPQQILYNNQNPSNNTVAATIQTLEIESKGGWPVLMPTKMDSDSVPNSAAAGGCVGGTAQTNGTALGTKLTGSQAADALPDILSTMSISNQTISNTKDSKVINVDIGKMVQGQQQQVAAQAPIQQQQLPPQPTPVVATSLAPAEPTPVAPQQPQQQQSLSSNSNPNEPKDLLSQFDPLFT